MTEGASIPGELPPHTILGMRLEGIFMPHSRKQRADSYSKSKRFVHYTSADNALKIIKTKRLWMRSTTCMADYSEVEHGYQMLVSFFSDEKKRKLFGDVLDICAPGAAMEALTLFDQWWAHIRTNSYVASISEHEDGEDWHGRLSMWRAFGGTLARVALVFRVPEYSGGAEQLNIMFGPVAYMNEKEVHETLSTVIENISANENFLRTLDKQVVVANIFQMLLFGVTCLKHEGFKEEREWRAIYVPKFARSPLMISSTEVVGGHPADHLSNSSRQIGLSCSR
jgi:Protein of unknown function (DUF2971)